MILTATTLEAADVNRRRHLARPLDIELVTEMSVDAV
jgi:hypothetical protein